MIAAKPTTYSNARFRSRLEAKWAAFFDLCGWRWEYEPLDLDGWVPDFGIVGHKGLILCEVKPIEWTRDRDENGRMMKRPDLGKLARVAKERELVVLGAYPFSMAPRENYPENSDFAYLGAFYTIYNEETFGGSREDFEYFADFAIFNERTGIDFRSEYQGFDERISGFCDGDNYGQEISFSRIKAMWNQASSLVQWNARD